MGLVWGDPIPDEYILWELIESTGWSVEYALNLPEARWREWLAVRDGKANARSSITNKRRNGNR